MTFNWISLAMDAILSRSFSRFTSLRQVQPVFKGNTV